MLLYPVYAVLFAETGLSAAQISSLFIIWSLTSFAVELPSGVWADVFSRRRLLIAGPVLSATGFGLWAFAPSYPAFAVGFMLWGAGGALRSGALQALVYEELERVGAHGSYARLIGRSEALATTAVMAATAVAAPALAAGGYRALGAASVAALLLTALVGRSFPESRGVAGRGGAQRGEARPGHHEAEPGEARSGGAGRGDAGRGGAYVRVFRDGVAEMRRSAPVRRALLYVAVLAGVTSIDEYIPLLAQSTGVAAAVVPLLVLLFTVGDTIGGWLAGYGARLEAAALGAAALCLAVGALIGTPPAMVLVAAAFGIFRWAMAIADARLQDRIGDTARATVTSMAGFGAEVMALTTYASYALGSAWAGPGPLFAVAAVPYLALSLALWWSRRCRRGP